METIAAVFSAVPHEAVTDTPSGGRKRHCLYIPDVVIFRAKGSSTLLLDTDLTVQKALADTGTGPSVITTGLLSKCPRDACVVRDQLDKDPQVCGPDGRTLRTHGHATVTFSLAGLACRHRFLVTEGASMLLLGNDFSQSRDANIQLSAIGPCFITLRSQLNGGAGHHVPVTTIASEGERPTALTIQPEGIVSDSEADEPLPPLEKPLMPPLPPLDFDSDPREPIRVLNSQEAVLKALPEPPGPSAPLMEGEVKSLHHEECLLFSGDPVRIPSWHQATFLVKLPISLSGRLDAAILVDRLPSRAGVENPPLVEMHLETLTVDGKVYVTVWNTSRRAITLPAFSAVASAYIEFKLHEAKVPGGDPNDAVSALTPEQRELHDSVVIDPDKQLRPDQLVRVRQLLARWITAFALDPKEPGHTHLMEVELPLLPGASTHRHAPKCLGDKGQAIVDQMVAEMEARGIIRKSNSAWGSRVVLVSKRDGAVHFCVDYRDLNAKLRLSDSPLPLTAEAIDRLSSGNGSRDSFLLCTLDLASSFWCMPVKEEDKHKAAFVTHQQKYEFNYLPFGVLSGPSYICRLMDAVLQGLAWEICMPYLDDIGIWSNGVGDTLDERLEKSFEQMLHRLDLILERLIWAGLTCKATKCKLFAISAEYLGHIISRLGLEMAPGKISAVRDTDPKSINSLEKLRSFLGLCSYYRRFIKGFLVIATPLTDLTKKDVNVEAALATEPCQHALRTLILAITSAPVLTAPRGARMFIVKTDAASKKGLGGVLSQLDDDGHERVVAYYGRRLNSAEHNDSVTEIELLAALESIRAWRPYFWGRRFRLVVDHAALRWLHTMKDTVEGGPSSRLMRWALKLAEYNFTVEHKPGAMHKDADGISRLVAHLETAGRPEYLEAVHAVNPSPADLKSSRSSRARVTTARSLQSAERANYQTGTTQSSINKEYMSANAPTTEVIAEAQPADSVCHELITFLMTGLHDDAMSSEDLKRHHWLSKQVSRFEMVDGLLYRRVPSQAYPQGNIPTALRLYVPLSLREAYLVAFHEHLCHLGTSRMAQVLRARYFWPGQSRDVAEHVHSCHECTLDKPPFRRPAAPKGPTVGSYPFDVVFCDVLFEAQTIDYVKGGAGYDKLLVFIDSLSRWIEAEPFNGDPNSEQVLHVLCRRSFAATAPRANYAATQAPTSSATSHQRF